MIASALQGGRTAHRLYTSPYLVQFYERIRVDGVMISDDDLDAPVRTGNGGV